MTDRLILVVGEGESAAVILSGVALSGSGGWVLGRQAITVVGEDNGAGARLAYAKRRGFAMKVASPVKALERRRCAAGTIVGQPVAHPKGGDHVS